MSSKSLNSPSLVVSSDELMMEAEIGGEISNSSLTDAIPDGQLPTVEDLKDIDWEMENTNDNDGKVLDDNRRNQDRAAVSKRRKLTALGGFCHGFRGFCHESRLNKVQPERDDDNLLHNKIYCEMNEINSDFNMIPHLPPEYVEEERRWLRYSVEILTREQCIVYCILGHLVFTTDELLGRRENVPTAEEARQALLCLTVGSHWDLANLAHIFHLSTRVQDLIDTGMTSMWDRKSMDWVILDRLGSRYTYEPSS